MDLKESSCNDNKVIYPVRMGSLEGKLPEKINELSNLHINNEQPVKKIEIDILKIIENRIDSEQIISEIIEKNSENTPKEINLIAEEIHIVNKEIDYENNVIKVDLNIEEKLITSGLDVETNSEIVVIENDPKL